MTRLLGVVGAVAGSSAGWAVAAPFGTFAAFVASVVGTGLGIYLGRRIGRHYEG